MKSPRAPKDITPTWVEFILNDYEQRVVGGGPPPSPGDCLLVDVIRNLKPVEPRRVVGGGPPPSPGDCQLVELPNKPVELPIQSNLIHPSVAVLRNVTIDWRWMMMTGMIKTK